MKKTVIIIIIGIFLCMLGPAHATIIKGSLNFDDKLIYRKANNQYKRALRDLEYRNEAERKMNYLKEFLPSKEDEFFNKDRKLPNGKHVVKLDCYKWIADSI